MRTVWSQIVTWVRQESPTTQALIQVLIAIGIAFGWWHWTDAQIGVVVGISAALLSMFVRSQVTPLVRPMDAGRPLISDPSSLTAQAGSRNSA
jgi:Na+/H+ antiporter NhaC